MCNEFCPPPISVMQRGAPRSSTFKNFDLTPLRVGSNNFESYPYCYGGLRGVEPINVMS